MQVVALPDILRVQGERSVHVILINPYLTSVSHWSTWL